MPTRPSLIREVYAELCIELGDTHSRRKLLEVASALVAESQAGSAPRFTLHIGGAAFDERPLYHAFADGGYKVWCREAANDDGEVHPRELQDQMERAMDLAA